MNRRPRVSDVRYETPCIPDPSVFQDAVAEQTSWRPMRRMARRTGRFLQQESEMRWVFRSRPLTFLAPLLISLTGVILLAAFAVELGASATLTAWFFLAILASGFAYIGITTAWEKATPMVFDLDAGFIG
jgi:hypothetical protein